MLGAVKLSISRDGIACGLVWERTETVTEAHLDSVYIRSYRENGQRLVTEMTPDEIDEETIRWMESVSNIDSMASN